MDVGGAELIATIAHAALGQTRADGVTPYITHPRRVAQLTRTWIKYRRGPQLDRDEAAAAIDAAYLHDVLEDTRLTREDLLAFGIGHRTVEIVELLTKPDAGPAPPSYYAAIAGDNAATLVKCADRCANLEDALFEVHETRGLRRWRRYVEKTYVDVLPIYRSLPHLRVELEGRLRAIEHELPPDAPRAQDPPPHRPPDSCLLCVEWRARHPARGAA